MASLFIRLHSRDGVVVADTAYLCRVEDIALIPGAAGCLWRAERGIELTRKAQALQDMEQRNGLGGLADGLSSNPLPDEPACARQTGDCCVASLRAMTDARRFRSG